MQGSKPSTCVHTFVYTYTCSTCILSPMGNVPSMGGFLVGGAWWLTLTRRRCVSIRKGLWTWMRQKPSQPQSVLSQPLAGIIGPLQAMMCFQAAKLLSNRAAWPSASVSPVLTHDLYAAVMSGRLQCPRSLHWLTTPLNLVLRAIENTLKQSNTCSCRHCRSVRLPERLMLLVNLRQTCGERAATHDFVCVCAAQNMTVSRARIPATNDTLRPWVSRISCMCPQLRRNDPSQTLVLARLPSELCGKHQGWSTPNSCHSSIVRRSNHAGTTPEQAENRSWSARDLRETQTKHRGPSITKAGRVKENPEWWLKNSAAAKTSCYLDRQTSLHKECQASTPGF